MYRYFRLLDFENLLIKISGDLQSTIYIFRMSLSVWNFKVIIF